MALMNYQDARPWAKAIRQAVITKKMPPWFADPSVGHFANDRSLSQSEIDTLIAWVDGGTKEGDIKDAPAPRKFVEGWNIGKPDMVLQMPNAFEVPASGKIDYQYVIIPTGLKEDTWVSKIEVRPGARAQYASRDRACARAGLEVVRGPSAGSRVRTESWRGGRRSHRARRICPGRGIRPGRNAASGDADQGRIRSGAPVALHGEQ